MPRLMQQAAPRLPVPPQLMARLQLPVPPQLMVRLKLPVPVPPHLPQRVMLSPQRHWQVSVAHSR
jgi:hypothetical protein